MRIISLDFETTKIPHFHPWDDKAYPISLCIVDESGFKKTWVINHMEVSVPQSIKQISREVQEEVDMADRIVGHNLKFDLNWLSYIGVKFDNQKLWCTKVVEYLINGHKKIPYSLREVSKRRGLVPKIDKVKIFWEAGYETDEIPLHILTPYGEQDCFNTLALYQQQVKDVNRLGLKAVVSIEMEKMRMLSEIECNGMLVDKAKAESLVEDLKRELYTIDKLIWMFAGFEFNISSNDELSAVLYGGDIKRDGTEIVERELKDGTIKKYERNTEIIKKIKGLGFIPPKDGRTKKDGYYKVNKDVLQSLPTKNKVQKQMIKLLVERSVHQKALETFIGKEGKGLLSKIMSDGCIHPEFNQSITATGRLSSSNPNGQNLPRSGTSPIKLIFVPKFDLIGNADVSMLEWTVAAFMSQDPVMMHEIRTGIDAHADNAIKFFGDIKYRTQAKVFTFRLLYGGTAYGMYMDSTMPKFSIKKWETIVTNFYDKYPVLKSWQDQNVETVYKSGQLVLPSGRILSFQKRQQKDGGLGYNRREILNRPVQSFATADIMGLAMVVIRKRMRLSGFRSRAICQVHDSLVFDVDGSEVKIINAQILDTFKNLPNYMRSAWGIDFNLPMSGKFEIGNNYGELKEYGK